MKKTARFLNYGNDWVGKWEGETSSFTDGICLNGAVTIEVYGLELAQNMPQSMHAMLQAESLHRF